jgi:hypothetical protein
MGAKYTWGKLRKGRGEKKESERKVTESRGWRRITTTKKVACKLAWGSCDFHGLTRL